MSTASIIAICVLLALVGAALVIPPYLAKRAKESAVSRCAALKARRAGEAVQGGNPVVLAQLDYEIKTCLGEAAALGAPVDVGAAVLEGCIAKGEQISQEWAHYKSTSYSDPVKRNNTRGTILRTGEEMARCFSGALDEVTTVPGAEAIKAEITKQLAYSVSRRACYDNNMPGCGRDLLNEDHGNDKSAAERDRIEIPLREQLARANEKIAELTASTRPALNTSSRATLRGTLGRMPSIGAIAR